MGSNVDPRLAVLLALIAAGTGTLDAQAPPPLTSLSFMAGCWEGTFRARTGETGVIEEHYTAPSDNVMLGTTRYLLNGVTTQFELTSIRLGEQGVVLLPYPGGRPSADGFTLTHASGSSATFEAPEHDFPKRITYRAESPDRIVARIDDGSEDGRATEWRMERRSCPGS